MDAPECAAAVDVLISRTPLAGISWEERFTRFPEDLLRVDGALEDPGCNPTGWDPELAARCAADAFYNVAVLFDACPHGVDGSLTESQFAGINQDGLLSDVSQLNQIATADRFATLQNSWLKQRCQQIVCAPVLEDRCHVQRITDELHDSRGDHAWAEYI